MGNHPGVDLMAYSPRQSAFAVDDRKNVWPVREQAARKGLFYVFAFVAGDAVTRFFVLTQEQVNKGIRENFKHFRGRAKNKGRNVDRNPFLCVEWKYAENFENAWRSLPQ